MPYDISTPEGRHAAAAAGVNTLGNGSGGPPATYWKNDQLFFTATDDPVTGSDGQPITTANIRAYAEATANEDARRFDVGQSNAVVNQQQAARAHADQVAESKRSFQEGQRQFNLNYGLSQQNFGEGQRQFNVNTGKSLLDTAATYRGPLNFVQGDMVAQGITQGFSPFIQSLKTGQPVQFGGGTATSGNPTPLTVGTLANTLSGQPAVGGGGAGLLGATGAPSAMTDAYGRPALSPDVQAAVDAGSQTFTSGLANKPLGFLENQTKSQRDALSSIGSYLGRDVAADDEYYRRSRPGQGAATLA